MTTENTLIYAEKLCDLLEFNPQTKNQYLELVENPEPKFVDFRDADFTNLNHLNLESAIAFVKEAYGEEIFNNHVSPSITTLARVHDVLKRIVFESEIQDNVRDVLDYASTRADILKNAEKLEPNFEFQTTFPVKGLYENGTVALRISKDDVGENAFTVMVTRETDGKGEIGSISGNLEDILTNLHNGTQELYNNQLAELSAPLTDIYNYTDVQKFLEEVIEQCCDKDGMYEIFFDYRDVIQECTLLETFQKYQEAVENGNNDYPDFHAYLESVIYEEWDLEYHAENDISNALERALDKNPAMRERFEEYTEQFQARYEYLENAGYGGAKFDVNDILGTYQLNLMFATEQEKDFDMGSIYDMFYADNIKSEAILQKVNDNALAIVIEQQGYDIKDVIAMLHDEDKKSDSPFVKSVVTEASNYFGYTGELTLLASVSGKEVTDLLEAIAKGEGSIEIPSYDKNPEVNFGIFNEWSGCGSLLELHLEKPVTLPTSMIRNVQVERAGRDLNRGITVDSTYGLISSAWQNVELKKDNAELQQEKKLKLESPLKE